jgi:hypothetical protein
MRIEETCETVRKNVWNETTFSKIGEAYRSLTKQLAR